jgi:hypothetical protein
MANDAEVRDGGGQQLGGVVTAKQLEDRGRIGLWGDDG